MYEYGILKLVKVILRRGRVRKNNGGSESNLGTLPAYMEMSQQNSLYNYHMLMKTLKIN
jgi:hypothetical protein